MDRLTSLCSNPIFAASCIKDWEKFGKRNFLAKCKEADMITGIRLFTDFILKLIGSEVKLYEIGENNVDNSASRFFESKLMDYLWIIDSSIVDINSDAIKDRYIRIMEILKGHLNQALVMERLSEDTLENLSLIQSKHQFQTRYVRTKTRLFFKQQKFNLLHEENEGYAKLITELSQVAVGSTSALMTTISQIQSLIGYFDLDPNRVLDLMLDVCEFQLALSNDDQLGQQFVQLIRLYNPDKLDLTHTLGHKFHFTYEPGSITPNSLYKFTSHLIWKNLVDLDVLYNHLIPLDLDIQSSRTRQVNLAKAYKPQLPPSLSLSNCVALNCSLNNAIQQDLLRPDVSTQFGASASLLGPGNSMASNSVGSGLGPNNGLDSTTWNSCGLDDHDTNEGLASAPAADFVDERESDPCQDALYENNQKLDLCTHLIMLGDWTNAQRLIDRLPAYWATNYQPLTRALCSLLHCLIEPLYNRVCPLPSCLKKNRPKHDSKSFGAFQAVVDEQESNDDVVMDAAATECGSQTALKPVHDFTGLVKRVIPIAIYLGSQMSRDLVLMIKFCRLGYVYLAKQQANKRLEKIDAVYQSIFNLLDEVLLPSMSLVEANCCLSEEIWQLLRFMPYYHRYRLYGQWKHVTIQSEPNLIRRRAQIVCHAKAIMKRLSKENVKPMGRQLGKLSHSNPGLLFDHVLSTIQMFTNLIGPVVEALKYVSSLGYDMLTFCIIEALASDQQSKLDDLQLSQSLQALSTFTGLLCRKYQFDLVGILQYVLNQLKIGKSYDLSILREILHRMSGIDLSEEMTDEQLESMSGGEVLLQEGGYYAQIRNTRKNATRLKEALIDNNLVMPFVFLMAQQRDAIIFLDDTDRHVKLSGRLYDQCQGTLVQFITFLSLQLSRDEMQAQCLPIERMMAEFHVPADTAFCLHRSLFEQKVARLFENKQLNELNKSNEKSKSVVKMLFTSASQEVCHKLAEAVKSLYSPRVWDELGSNFFVTFWSLQSSDLVVPEAAYQRQMQQLKDQIQQIQLASNPWATSKKKREIDRLESLIDRLSSEQLNREQHVLRVRAWLMAERDHWFQTRLVTKTDTITQFLQLCIYPRVCFTTADAVYAAQFMHVLHQLKTARFSTLICLDRIFNDITLPTSMCTENEAHRYGRFLCAVLELVMRWHASEDVFNQECGQSPGFVTVFRKTYHGLDANTKPDQLQFEDYRHVVHKWHYRITKAIVACLESGNYVQIRNALIVLTRILPQYPRITQFGSAVERRVNKLKEEEKDRRPDLKALAFSYAGLMRPRKSKWTTEEDFHQKQPVRPVPQPPRSNVVQPTADTSSRVHSSNTAANSSAVPGQTSNTAVGVTQSSGVTEVRRTSSSSSSLTNAPSTVTKSSNAELRSKSQSVSAAASSYQPSVQQSTEPVSSQSSGLNSTCTPTNCATNDTAGGGRSTESVKLRRVEGPSLPQMEDAAALPTKLTSISSKRRRVELSSSTATSVPSNVVSQSNSSNVLVGSMSTPNASLLKHSSVSLDDGRESGRKSGRKRSTPTSSTTNSASGAVNTSDNLLGRHVRSTTDGSLGAVVTGGHHTRHHSSRSSQRSSSVNSVENKDSLAVDDDRLVVMSSSSGLRKSKKSHHHHHQRNSGDSASGSVLERDGLSELRHLRKKEL